MELNINYAPFIELENKSAHQDTILIEISETHYAPDIEPRSPAEFVSGKEEELSYLFG